MKHYSFQKIHRFTKRQYFQFLLENECLKSSRKYAEQSKINPNKYWHDKLKINEEFTLATADSISLHDYVSLSLEKKPFENFLVDKYETEINKNIIKRPTKKALDKRLAKIKSDIGKKVFLEGKFIANCKGLDSTLACLKELDNHSEGLQKTYKEINCSVNTKDEFLIACIHLCNLAILTFVTVNIYLEGPNSADHTFSMTKITFGEKLQLFEIKPEGNVINAEKSKLYYENIKPYSITQHSYISI